LRMFDLTLPVRIEHDGSPQAARLARHLRLSCRFRLDREGFPLRVSREGEALVVRMDRLGEQHAEGKSPLDGEGGEGIPAAFRRFPGRLASPWLELTAVEINSVQGVTLAQPADQKLPGRPR